jgi:hypothetical protein
MAREHCFFQTSNLENMSLFGQRGVYINNLLAESECSTGKYPTEVLHSCCIDREIARSIQQDRGWIFSRAVRTVEVSKFLTHGCCEATSVSLCGLLEWGS